MPQTIRTKKPGLAALVVTSMLLSGCTAQTEQPRLGISHHYSTVMPRQEGMRVLKQATQGNEVAYLRRGDEWINFGMLESERSVLPDWQYVKPLHDGDEFIHTHPDSPFPSIPDIGQYFDHAIPQMKYTVPHPYGRTTFYSTDLLKENELFISRSYPPAYLKTQFEEQQSLGKSPPEAIKYILESLNQRLGGKMIFSFEEEK